MKIQKEGKLLNPTAQEAKAVEKILIEQRIVYPNLKSPICDGKDVAWSNGSYGTNVDASGAGFKDDPLHTLHDFGLRPGGYPELTDDDLVVGDSYRVRGDLKQGMVIDGIVTKSIRACKAGKVLTLRGKDSGHPGCTAQAYSFYGEYFWWTAAMLEPFLEYKAVNTPKDQPQTLSVGDNAIDTKSRHCKILAIADGYAMCRFEGGAEQKHPVRAVEMRKLRKWPGPIHLFDDYEARFCGDVKGVHIHLNDMWHGVIGFDTFDRIAEAVAKIRNA